MTICVAVGVYDGVVFAADSAASLIGLDANQNPAVMNVYQHGNKVFNLIRGLPVVAMTCGMGNFGSANIASLTKDLRRALGEVHGPDYVNPLNFTMLDVVTKAKAFFDAAYAGINPPPPNPHSFDYWIAGFGSNSNTQEIYSLHIENGVSQPAQQLLAPVGCGLVWGGQPEAINRLVTGFTGSAVPALVTAGMNQQLAQQLIAVAMTSTQAQLVAPAMPIQDAIELADFLVETTKRFVRFLPGADVVGGSTDIAVVTRHERFKWIRRKHYYSSDLNRLETDHV